MIFLILFWMKLHNFLQATDMKKSHKPKFLRVIQIINDNMSNLNNLMSSKLNGLNFHDAQKIIDEICDINLNENNH